MKKKILLVLTFILLISIFGGLMYFYKVTREVGKVVDEYKGVPVYNNGIVYQEDYGRNFNDDGYYYGQKWQCVEFVKRFYYDAKDHKMPDVYGNAKDFFDDRVLQGQINTKRNLIQYRNGDNEKPQQDDLIVFNDTKFGHVAIITQVTNDYIEVIQQNIFGKPREQFTIQNVDGKWFIGNEKKPAGWLRKL